MPVLIPNIPFIGRRRRRGRTPPAALGPVLQWATFDGDAEQLTLSFDRDIDMSSFVPADVAVLDAGTLQEFGGTIDTTMLDPQTVRIVLIVNGEYAGEVTKLTATGGAGIVSTVGAEPWAGCTDLQLPYP